MLTEVGGLAGKYGGFVCEVRAVCVCVCVCAAVYRWNRPASLPLGCLSVSVLVCVCRPVFVCA